MQYDYKDSSYDDGVTCPEDTPRGPCCDSPQVAERVLAEDLDPGRAALIRYNEKKWVNETVLQYHFLQNPELRGASHQEDAVRDAFQIWKDLGIGLEFVETALAEEAEIRIGFKPGNSWSYTGRDILKITDPTKQTMNYGWDLRTPYGRDTALHEIGHVLGFPHEHQNPRAGIVWNEEKVLEHFSGPPNNWHPDKTHWNILRKIPAQDLDGTNWDPDSIMHYRFDAGLIAFPLQYRTQPLIPTPGLSDTDIQEVQRFYPPVDDGPDLMPLAPFQSQTISIDPGEQLNFVIEPTQSRDYTIQTFGPIDTVTVLFEEIDGQPRFLAGDDNSGQNKNALIQTRLFRGRRYILRIRLYFAEQSGIGAVMVH